MHEGDPKLGDLRILVVDDFYDAAISLAALLELKGYHTGLAHNGLEAVQAATRVRYDVVLLDLGMPVMDGFEAAALLRQLRPAPKLIACSAWGDAETRRRTAARGFFTHLTKPVPLDVLETALWLAHEELAREEAHSRDMRRRHDETQEVAHPHEPGQGFRSHLAHDLPAVNLDGHLAHAQIARDLLVHAPGDHERHDLPLARRELGDPLP
jgi:CheY-like chemotaxis protein